MQNEKAVKAQVKKILDACSSASWWFMPPANGFGRSGIPDFVGCVHGHLFAIETKSGSNTLSPHQMREIEKLVQAGAKVWVVREASLSSFEIEFAAWVALCS